MGEDNTIETGMIYMQVDGEWQPMMNVTELPEFTMGSLNEDTGDRIDRVCTTAKYMVNILNIRNISRLVRKLLTYSYQPDHPRNRNIERAIRMMYWARVRSNRRRYRWPNL